MHILDVNPKEFKKCKNGRETSKLCWAVLKRLGVKKHVIQVSLVGHSVIELYVIADQVGQLTDKLDKQGIKYSESLDLLTPPSFAREQDVRSRLVRRLAGLYQRANLKNLRECILNGFDDDTKASIRLAAGEKVNIIVLSDETPAGSTVTEPAGHEQPHHRPHSPTPRGTGTPRGMCIRGRGGYHNLSTRSIKEVEMTVAEGEVEVSHATVDESSDVEMSQDIPEDQQSEQLNTTQTEEVPTIPTSNTFETLRTGDAAPAEKNAKSWGDDDESWE